LKWPDIGLIKYKNTLELEKLFDCGNFVFGKSNLGQRRAFLLLMGKLVGLAIDGFVIGQIFIIL
jgi:hypothetical protein